MQSLIQHLANNESVLLMYLAEELPPQDRAEVDAMLDRDPAMRRELEQLRETYGKAIESLTMLDAMDPMRISDATTIRRTSRTIRQWQVDRAAANPPQEEVRKMRYPWWAYPAVSVAAAAVLLVFLMWWSSNSEVPELTQNSQQLSQEGRDTTIAGVITSAISYPEHQKNLDLLADTEDELLALSGSGQNSETGAFWIDTSQ
jgi:anti-sigma factor RsiW